MRDALGVFACARAKRAHGAGQARLSAASVAGRNAQHIPCPAVHSGASCTMTIIVHHE